MKADAMELGQWLRRLGEDGGKGVVNNIDARALRRAGEKLMTTEVKLLEFQLAFGDAIDAVDYAHSEGFEWPADPITPHVKFVLDRYCERSTK